MSKNIWIINEYAGTPYHGMEFRHFYIGKALVALGHKVTVISSSYSHLFKKQPDVRKEVIEGVNYRWLTMFNYGTSHDKRRVLKWMYFMVKVFFLPLFLKKPDVIIVSPMAPFVIIPAWFLAKVYNVKLVYEVKDIWPLSLIELGGFSPSHPFIKAMAWCESFAIKHSDVVVSNLQNYGKHISDLGMDKSFEWISNGVDLEELRQSEPLPKELINQIPANKFIVGYTGTIGVANALDSLCEAAKQMEENKNIAFVIVGDGQEKHNLEQTYGKLANIHFIEAINKREIQSMLHMFNVCYIGLKKEKLFRYGVSPNKLFDYMFSAKPILYAIESGKNSVETAQCGVSICAENVEQIVEAVNNLYGLDDTTRKEMGMRGKDYVVNHFSYQKLAKKLENIL